MRSRLYIIKRLDTHRIARDKQAMPSGVPETESKHAAKSGEALFAPACVSLEHDFGIRVADQTCAGSFKFAAEFTEVIDLAVVDNPVASFGILHWLVPQRGEVENRQAAVPQTDLSL